MTAHGPCMGGWIVCVGTARGGVCARRVSGHDDAVSIGRSRLSCRRRRRRRRRQGRGAHEVRVVWGVPCASGGRVMASVHVGRGEGVQVIAGGGGGEQGRVEAWSRRDGEVDGGWRACESGREAAAAAG